MKEKFWFWFEQFYCAITIGAAIGAELAGG